MLPRNQWVNEEMKEEIITSLKTNTNDNTTLQNLWDTAKLTLRDNFINKNHPWNGMTKFQGLYALYYKEAAILTLQCLSLDAFHTKNK